MLIIKLDIRKTIKNKEFFLNSYGYYKYQDMFFDFLIHQLISRVILIIFLSKILILLLLYI